MPWTNPGEWCGKLDWPVANSTIEIPRAFKSFTRTKYFSEEIHGFKIRKCMIFYWSVHRIKENSETIIKYSQARSLMNILRYSSNAPGYCIFTCFYVVKKGLSESVFRLVTSNSLNELRTE